MRPDAVRDGSCSARSMVGAGGADGAHVGDQRLRGGARLAFARPARVRGQRLPRGPQAVDARPEPHRRHAAREPTHRHGHLRDLGFPVGVRRSLCARLPPHRRTAADAPRADARASRTSRTSSTSRCTARPWRWGDLTQPPNSAWIVRLIDDVGDETAPADIEHIAKPGALERTYFPYTTVWRQASPDSLSARIAPDRRPTIAAKRALGRTSLRGSRGERDRAPLGGRRADVAQKLDWPRRTSRR